MFPNILKSRLIHVRNLSGTNTKFLAAPPGYFNNLLPKNEQPAALPAGPMTPEIRSRLAAKYNMRAEDYKPCAWHPEYRQFGDYPQLNFQNAGEHNGNYDWDEYWWRRNFGDPIHVDATWQKLAFKQNHSPYMHGNYSPEWDRQRFMHYYFIGQILPYFVAIAVYYYLTYNNMQKQRPMRKGEFWHTPWTFEDNHWWETHYEDSWNAGYRFWGGVQGREDDRFERWGTRYTVNYCIPGWEDLDKTPSYQHTW